MPDIFNSNYYDEKYFADKDGKAFRRPGGITDHWGYRNPEGEWTGCKPIVKAWDQIFHPTNMLDVGCGRGTFVAYSRDIGIKAEGFDFSEWAVNNPYHRCKKEWIRTHDATKHWPYLDRHFDLVIVLDLMEHLYTDDIDFVLNEIHRVSRKWIFLQIAISDKYTHYALKKGEESPIELEGCTVAGHVTVQPESFWYEKLNKEGWRIRKDIVQQFSKIVPSEIIKNWLLSLIIVMERI